MGFKKFYQTHEENQSEFDYSEFAIFPLEGIWSTKNTADITDKASFEYKIMLRQPELDHAKRCSRRRLPLWQRKNQ